MSLLSVQTSSHQITVIMDLQSCQLFVRIVALFLLESTAVICDGFKIYLVMTEKFDAFFAQTSGFVTTLIAGPMFLLNVFPGLTPHRRKTKRLKEKLTMIAFSTSCLKAEKVCQDLHMPVSHDTLLALVYRKRGERRSAPFRRIG